MKINYRPSENMSVQQVKQRNIWELKWAFEFGTKLGTMHFKLLKKMYFLTAIHSSDHKKWIYLQEYSL